MVTHNRGPPPIRGLVINRFQGSAIWLDENGDNKIAGNFIGTDVAGCHPLGNTGTRGGVFIGFNTAHLSNNVIGGTTPASRNLISGNQNAGINIQPGSGTQVIGNLIGTDAAGLDALPNRSNSLGLNGHGILVFRGDNIQIGGSSAGAGNLISGNGLSGVFICGASPSAGSRVEGNLIGTDIIGAEPLGNKMGVFACRETTIGGTMPGTGNLISGNSILGNSIHSNLSTGLGAGLGIDLGAKGVTSNDIGDSDIGPNNLQNFPQLTFATTGSVEGTLHSNPNTEYRIEFFANANCDPSRFGEGELFLGSTDAMTNGSGDANFTGIFPVSAGESDCRHCD